MAITVEPTVEFGTSLKVVDAKKKFHYEEFWGPGHAEKAINAWKVMQAIAPTYHHEYQALQRNVE